MNVAKNNGFIALLCFMLVSFISAAKNHTNTQYGVALMQQDETQTLTHLTMQSDVLAEQREMIILLPESYQQASASKQHYPVIYLLDGRRHMPHAKVAMAFLQQELMVPESIVVAITNNRGTRTRDLSQQKQKFGQFIKDELMTVINNTYRTSGHNTLFGHSMAGYFTIDMLATMPTVFANYVAASPVLQMNNSAVLDKYKDESFAERLTQKRHKSLYFTLTDAVYEGASATQALNDFVAQLTAYTPKNLTWHYDFIPGQQHMTTPYLTLYQGLSFAFSDFQPPIVADVDAYEKMGGLKGIEHYYAQRAQKYQVANDVPESALRRIGFTVFDTGAVQQGIAILKHNSEKHPKSLRALNALGTVYEESKQIEAAIATFAKALVLAQELGSSAQNRFKRQLEQLEKLHQ